MSQAPLLMLEQVSKWYGPVLALNQVTLALHAPITGLVGANGSGKSTLIKLATGQIAPSIGRVTINGIAATDWRANRLVGYCPDHDAFYEDLSGRQFVFEMARLFGYATVEAKQRTETVLQRMGMSERADRKLRGYSKGMRQRVKLALALLHDPALLILDEPLSGIDPVGRQELMTLFRELAASGKHLLISSHELEELEKLTDTVAIMARGRVAAVGTLDEIRNHLEDRPACLRIDVDDPRRMARSLFGLDSVLGAECSEHSVLVRVKQAKRFYPEFNALVATSGFQVSRLEALDDSTHALLGYLLGGSGKT